MKKYLMEGIGAFFLTLTVIVAMATNLAPGMTPLAVGAILIVLTFAGTPISGAQYNPALSLARFMQGSLDRFDLPYYIMAQLAGTVLAAFIAVFLLRCSGVPDLVVRSNDAFCALLSEFFGAFLLVFAVLATSPQRDTGNLAVSGLSVGLAQFSGMFVLSRISGGFFNPALVTGLCVAGLTAWADWWLYCLGACLGAAAAVSIFRVINSHPH